MFDATCPLVTKVHMEVAAPAWRKVDSDRSMPDTRKSKALWGQYNNPQGGMYLVESPEDVLKLESKTPGCRL